MNDDVADLLAPWPGPCGGLPPWDRVTPPAFEAAYRRAVEDKRAEMEAIAANPSPPTFANTLEALEDSGRSLRRLQPMLGSWARTSGTPEVLAMAARLAPLAAGLEDASAHETRLFARVDAVWNDRASHGLDADQERLVHVVRDRLLRRGAGLPTAARQRVAAIHARIATLFARFQANLQGEEQTQAVWIEREADLAGLPEGLRAQLRHAAADLGRPEAWAVRAQRALVWPVLTHAADRDLRERVWRLWYGRGGQAGAHDNRPVVTEILALRGEEARLFGRPSFAHLALADRMARTPETALAMLERTWRPVRAAAEAQIAEYQAIADAEGAGFTLQPWDRLHYAEKLRRHRFGIDHEALRAWLELERVFAALFWLAGRLHGLDFHPLDDAPRLDPSVRVYELRRGGEPVGVLYVDLFARPGKGHGSYQVEWRAAESFRGRVLPVSCIVSNLPRPADGEPVLLAWEYANVFFHEFGHALHMLSSTARYPSLGSIHVAWDFVELPSLLTERWLAEPELLDRFARHWQTGEPLPAAMRDALERSLRHERIFSVNPDYLAPAFVDLRMHLAAKGRDDAAPDPQRIEREVFAELGLPDAWDVVMRVPHLHHAWTDEYAAGLYVYLWADVMVADIAEAFAAAPGGWYDADVARRWRETILAVGHGVPAEQAFRDFRGRDPDPDALLRRFGLDRASA